MLVEDDLCHGINIKIAKSGINESLKLYNRAKKNGLKLMMGCMTETMIGLSAGINFAAGTGGFDYIDLDAIHFLYHKHSYKGITISGNHYLIDRSTIPDAVIIHRFRSKTIPPVVLAKLIKPTIDSNSILTKV